MSRLTIEEVTERIKLVNPNIEIIDDEYINARTHLKCMCLVDGHVWKATWSNLNNGRGCPVCRVNSLRKSHADFVKEVKEKQPTLKILNEYKNMRSMIKCVCKIDGCVFYIRADSLVIGYGCPECASVARSKTHDQFIREMKLINDKIEITSEYINKRTRVKCKCLDEGCEWTAYPNNLLDGYGCPLCNPSKGEGMVADVLEGLGMKYKQQHKFDECRNVLPLSFDFYIPAINTCIEYDGIQHFEPVEHFGGKKAFKRIVENDEIKNKFCEKESIKLIRIPYTKDSEEDIRNLIIDKLSIL